MAVKPSTVAVLAIPASVFVLSALLVAAYTQQAPGQDGSDWNPVIVNNTRDPEAKRQIDEILETVWQLRQQNWMYESSGRDDKDVQDAIRQNNATILRLMERLDVLSPPLPVVEISEADEVKMNAAMTKLLIIDMLLSGTGIGPPLLGMGIDQSTGTLHVMIDIDRADQHTEKWIRWIAPGVDFTFTYARDTASFQGVPATGMPGTDLQKETEKRGVTRYGPYIPEMSVPVQERVQLLLDGLCAQDPVVQAGAHQVRHLHLR